MSGDLTLRNSRSALRRLVTVVAMLAVLVAAFVGGGRISLASSHAAVRDSCTVADANSNSTTMTATENLYSCHPDTGNSLPTGGSIGSVPNGSHPGITGHWWNTVAVDGDSGSACQPSTKWLRGENLNFWSASCTVAP
jgi:hypothetical protein